MSATIWNALSGLAATCEFEGQTSSLVNDIFILNMHITAVQEKLCTEPKYIPEEALQFAVVIEKTVKRQVSCGRPKQDSHLNLKNWTNFGVYNYEWESLFLVRGFNFYATPYFTMQSCSGEMLTVNFCDVVGNSGQEYKEVHKPKVIKMQVDVIITLTLVTLVMVAMTRLLVI